MCQAYEAERNFVFSSEHWNTKKGFAAARAGKPKSANPHNQYGIHPHDYDRIAWDHGWECWHQKLLPYALELEIGGDGIERYAEREKTRQEFKETGRLPKELVDRLPND